MRPPLPGSRFGAASCLVLVLTCSGQIASLESFVGESLSGTSTDARFSLSASAGLVAPITLGDARFALTGELSATVAAGGTAGEDSVLLFDSTFGSANGSGIVVGNAWIATRFCVPASDLALASISLTLSSREPGTPVEVHLDLRAEDPVTGGPGNSLGGRWDLFGDSNPIQFTAFGGTTERVVTWVPSGVPVPASGACFWVVFGTGVGEVLAPVTLTPPKGLLAALGSTKSADAGATWQSVDSASSLRMQIRGGLVKQLRLTPQRGIGDRWEVAFEGTPGRSYELETRSRVEGGSWLPLPETRVTVEASSPAVIPLPASVAQRAFYRLREIP